MTVIEHFLQSSEGTPLERIGKIIIFSAPSGSGKTTIVKHLLNTNSNLGFSVSACTRPKRPHEVEGKDYYFLSSTEFKQKIENEEFIEWQEVYAGDFKGTLKSEIKRLWAIGKDILFDVDVKGGLNLKRQFGERALAVFVQAPSLEILEQRLRARNTETEETLQTRLAKVRYEITFASQFDVILLNENLDQTLLKAQTIVDDFLKS
jgi:guanylate kinase